MLALAFGEGDSEEDEDGVSAETKDLLFGVSSINSFGGEVTPPVAPGRWDLGPAWGRGARGAAASCLMPFPLCSSHLLG